MFARIKRRDPDTFMALVNKVAMFEINPADILMGLAHKRNNDTNIADGNFDHRHLLDLDEPRIKIPGSRQENLFLQSTTASAVDKRLRGLKVVMACDHRSRDFTSFNGRAIEGRNNANLIGFNARDAQILCVHAVMDSVRRRNYCEQSGVNTISASGKDTELASLFTAVS